MAVRADSPGSVSSVRRLAVESDRRVLRAANPDFLDIAVTRAN